MQASEFFQDIDKVNDLTQILGTRLFESHSENNSVVSHTVKQQARVQVCNPPAVFMVNCTTLCSAFCSTHLHQLIRHITRLQTVLFVYMGHLSLLNTA